MDKSTSNIDDIDKDFVFAFLRTQSCYCCLGNMILLVLSELKVKKASLLYDTRDCLNFRH